MDFIDLASEDDEEDALMEDAYRRDGGPGFCAATWLASFGDLKRIAPCPHCGGTGWITIAGTTGPYGDDPDYEEHCVCNAETDEFMDEAEPSPF